MISDEQGDFALTSNRGRGAIFLAKPTLDNGEDMTRKIVKYHIDDKEYSDTGEIFDSLFGKALRILFRKEKIEKAKDRYDKTRWAIKKRVESRVDDDESGTTAGKRDTKPPDQLKKGRKAPMKRDKSDVANIKTDARTSKGKKTKRPSRKRPGKGSSRLRTFLALILIVVLAGALANMYGIVDLGRLSGSLKSMKNKDIPLMDDISRLLGSLTSSFRGDSKPEAVQKAPEKTDQKPPRLARKAIEKGASGQTQPKEAPSPSKTESVAKAPKPVTAPQKEEASSKPVGHVQKGGTVNNPVSHTDNRGVSFEEGRLPVKPPVSYPYSIYLGSYKELLSAQNTIAEYEKKGLSPYRVRVDLGDKGVWFRIFTNYFKNKEEAEAHIRAKQIPEGKPRRTRYANLIGIFKSPEALHRKSVALSKIGYSPYVIPGADGDSLLYTGAFYQRATAEAEHTALASNGIQSRLVER